MSLSSIISTASTALSNTQYQIALANQNISDASDPGYSRKTAASTALTLDDATSTTTVTRAADAYLTKAVIASTSASAHDAAISSSLNSYDAALGSVANGGDPSSLITKFETAISGLSSASTGSAGAPGVVSSAQSLATGLRNLSSTIQGLRTQADNDIGADVATINTTLKTIASLNTQIASATPNSSAIADLEDQRDAALKTLSSSMGISYFTGPDNRVQVYSTSGDLLVGPTAATLSYTPSNTLSASTTYPAQISGVMLNGKDITSSLTTGDIGGLIALRDNILPSEQSKLDALASTLISTTNAVTNAGTSYPAPTSLTGAANVTATDAFSATGTLRVAVTDSKGVVSSTQDLNLSSYTTVGGLVTALNGISGVSASINSAGKLVIAAADGVSGVSLGDIGASVSPSGSGVSDYFGMNDLFQGSSASDIALSPALVAAPTNLPTATLSTAAGLTVGSTAIVSGDSSIADNLNTALSTQTAFAAAGDFPARTMSLQSYAAQFVASAATLVSNATSSASSSSATATAATTSLSNLTSVNTDEELANLTNFQQQYQANAQMIATVKALFTTLMTMMQTG